MWRSCGQFAPVPSHPVVFKGCKATMGNICYGDREGHGPMRTITVPDADLSRVPLLAKLTKRKRRMVAKKLSPELYHAGQVLIKEGDLGDKFFLITKGSCSVEVGGRQVSSLSPGDFCGEAALLSATAKRTATVTASTLVEVLTMKRDEFLKLNKKKTFHFKKRVAISAETLSNMSDMPEKRKIPKSKAQRTLIMRAIKKNILFKGLKRKQRRAVVDHMERRVVKKHEQIIEQGAAGNEVFIVESGRFEVTISRKGVTDTVAVVGAEQVVGELALMYNAPRSASVTAIEASVVWFIDRFSFRRICASVSDSDLKSYVQLLSKVEVLKKLTKREISKVAEALEEVKVPSQTTLITEGEVGDCMYFIVEGSLEIKQKNLLIKRMSKAGEFFGERALLKNEPRSATVVTVTKCHLLKLDKMAFELLHGPLEAMMGRREAEYRRESQIIVERLSRPACAYLLENMEELGVLGQGSFGIVTLVRDMESRKTFALKAISKLHIVENGQQEHIVAEKGVLERLKHSNIVHLYGTFKDRDRVYFLMEPVLGGELFTILRNQSLFSEDVARFYAAQVVLVFEYMHSKRLAYRDLKPENLLLANNGYLKVTDFGFAKQIRGRTYTLCGTPDYLAPEIVSGRGHGMGVDWWTLGILIYEMLASYPPFYDDNPMETYKKIIACKIRWPGHFSEEAKSLIQGLLTLAPTRRLGVVAGGATKIKQHPWFKGFDWQALERQELRAPNIPKVKGDNDTHNFVAEVIREKIPSFHMRAPWDEVFG